MKKDGHNNYCVDLHINTNIYILVQSTVRAEEDTIA